MKDKRLYYECVLNCQVGFMGLDQRKERWVDNQPSMCLHERTFLPENPFDKSKPAMILAVDRPLADRYVAEITKIIRRKNLRTGEWEDKPTKTKIKFVQLEPEDITSDIRARAVFMTLRDCDYAPA